LLPILARVLKVDVISLLSFNKDLTELEIRNFAEKITKMITGEGFDVAFKVAMNKISEYPTCEQLIFMVTFVLDSSIMIYPVKNKEQYQENIEQLYKRLLKSESEEFRNFSIFALIDKSMKQNDYERVEELIACLPDAPLFDKEEPQVNLYIEQEKFAEATEILGNKLIKEAKGLQFTLIGLVKIALKENRYEDTTYYGDLYEKNEKLYGIWEFSANDAHLEVAIAKKDVAECLRILKLMLTSMNQNWDKSDIMSSPLFRQQEVFADLEFNPSLLPAKIEEIKSDKKFNIIRDHLDYKQLLEKFDLG